MNVTKCEILAKGPIPPETHAELKEITEVKNEKVVKVQTFYGIPVVKEVKYLGLKLSCSMPTMLSKAIN